MFTSLFLVFFERLGRTWVGRLVSSVLRNGSSRNAERGYTRRDNRATGKVEPWFVKKEWNRTWGNYGSIPCRCLPHFCTHVILHRGCAYASQGRQANAKTIWHFLCSALYLFIDRTWSRALPDNLSPRRLQSCQGTTLRTLCAGEHLADSVELECWRYI